jgi:hypothetical protein
VRRNVIEDILDEQDLVLPVRRLADDGLKAWQEVVEKGYEGLVAKDPQSPYAGGPHALAAQGEAAGLSRQRMRPGPQEQIVVPTLSAMV